jgi:hypothetical protein
VVTVVEENGVLCGVISEGDLRRAILKGNSLDTPLENVMNTNPVLIKSSDMEDEVGRARIIDEIYQRYGTDQGQQATIPVIDSRCNVIGLTMFEMLQIKEPGASTINENSLPNSPKVSVLCWLGCS